MDEAKAWKDVLLAMAELAKQQAMALAVLKCEFEALRETVCRDSQTREFYEAALASQEKRASEIASAVAEQFDAMTALTAELQKPYWKN